MLGFLHEFEAGADGGLFCRQPAQGLAQTNIQALRSAGLGRDG